MIDINSSVATIPKIGPKFKKLLEKLEIKTVENLLYHFPFRYDDFSEIKEIKDLMLNDTATVKATLTEIKNIYTKNRKRLTRGKVMDSSGELEVIWFNQHFLARNLKIGAEYTLSGKVDSYNNKLTFMSPIIELAEQDSVNTGRLVPIYPETRGISSKWLRTKIKFLLDNRINVADFLPQELIKKYDLVELKKGLESFHFPNKDTDVEKAKKRFAFEELFLELLKVEERRTSWQQDLQGISLKLTTNEQKIDKFIKNLPFALTDSQEQAVYEILNDMTRKHPMNRLLEGDVGSGKTIVAVIAAYLAYLNGYKTVYMAPTEILATQHNTTFNEFLGNSGPKIVLKTGAKKSKLDDEFDIAIGTHAILHSKVTPTDVALVIIDEQHRFGVEQRTQLIKMFSEAKIPHLLTMTATPIPRTLALTLYGDLSISVLKTLPNKEKKITTWVVNENKRQGAYDWIKKKGEQTFIVCPLIGESESEMFENVKAAEAEYETLKNGVFADVEVGLLHGRMKAKEKNEVMDQFRDGRIKILVSTPVIEVGVDIPEATIMVIESAERYGLASLHQLRGRVGRGKKEAYCIVFQSNYSRNSFKRLKYLEKLNSGLELAEVDMKMRGQGDIYGTMQHGFKTFKVADMGDLSLLEAAKEEAAKYFQKLDSFPTLRKKLTKETENIGHN